MLNCLCVKLDIVPPVRLGKKSSCKYFKGVIDRVSLYDDIVDSLLTIGTFISQVPLEYITDNKFLLQSVFSPLPNQRK